MAYRISRKAEEDLLNIFRVGAEEYGLAQAESYHVGLEQAFQFLSDYPRAARERVEIAPPVRVHPFKAHLVVYLIDGPDILILRVRHAREDWMSQP